MKVLFVVFLAIQSAGAMAGKMHDFNKALIDGVQKDIKTDNDVDLKAKDAKRAPASVETEEAEGEGPQPKIDKLKQLGPAKW